MQQAQPPVVVNPYPYQPIVAQPQPIFARPVAQPIISRPIVRNADGTLSIGALGDN